MTKFHSRCRKHPGVLLVAAILLVLTGCSAPGADSESEGEATLTIATSQDIDTMDTHATTATSTEAAMVNIQSYLLKRDVDNVPQPLLVESYENVDPTTWHFTLREGVTFHNGDPLTAEDVKFSLERVALDKTLLQNANYNTIAEVRVLDDLSFDILTTKPDPVLPYRLAREGSGILPKKYIEEGGIEAYLEHPVGTGPYEFVEWVKGDHLTLKKYDDYFEGDVSDWDTVVFRYISEASTRVGELLAGSADLIDSIPVQDTERVETGDTELIDGLNTGAQMIYVNQNEGMATADPRVREAIDYAIDKEQLSEIFTGGRGTVTRTRVMPGAVGFEPSLYDTALYDPEKAEQLLAEVGSPVEITLTSSQGRTAGDAEMAQTLQGMLEAVGIKVKLQLLPAADFVTVRSQCQNRELMTTGWNNTFFDASAPLSHFLSTYAPKCFGYDNPEVDRLLDEAASTMDQDVRTKAFQEVQRIVAEERPYIYLYQQIQLLGASKSIDFTPRQDAMFYAQEIKRK